MIYHQDCLSFMQSLPNDHIDLIIADPPYYEICGDFDFIWNNLEEYLCWCQKWLLESQRILKSTGSIYLWGKIGFGKGFALFHLANWIEQNKLFKIVNWITQRNTRGRGTKKGFIEAREELLFMTKSDNYIWNPSYTNEPSNRKDLGFNGKPRKNKFKRCTDVWSDITEASQSSKERFKLSDGSSFPTVKSIQLCNRIISASSNVGDLVYIPFGGSGSEAVACQTLKRKWILTEINQHYVEELIKPRLESLGLINL
jgi:site-specific DNA-methyltransferase (adenine-specific)